MYALGRAEFGRQLHRAQPGVRRVRQVPDHAGELAGTGRPATSATRTPGRRRPTRRSWRAAKVRALYSGLQSLAARRLLVADRLEPDQRLVDLRDALRHQGDALLRDRGPAATSRRRDPGAGRDPRAGRRSRRRRLDPPLLGGEPEPRLQRSVASAAFPGYAGGAVRYATEAGAKATFTFNGHERHLVRAGRSDPRQGAGLRRRDAGHDGRPPSELVRRPRGGVQQGLGDGRPAHARHRGRRDGRPSVRRDRRAVTVAELGPTSACGRDLDLDAVVRGQGGHADRRPGRGVRREVRRGRPRSSPRSRRSRGDRPCSARRRVVEPDRPQQAADIVEHRPRLGLDPAGDRARGRRERRRPGRPGRRSRSPRRPSRRAGRPARDRADRDGLRHGDPPAAGSAPSVAFGRWRRSRPPG